MFSQWETPQKHKKPCRGKDPELRWRSSRNDPCLQLRVDRPFVHRHQQEDGDHHCGDGARAHPDVGLDDEGRDERHAWQGPEPTTRQRRAQHEQQCQGEHRNIWVPGTGQQAPKTCVEPRTWPEEIDRQRRDHANAKWPSTISRRESDDGERRHEIDEQCRPVETEFPPPCEYIHRSQRVEIHGPRVVPQKSGIRTNAQASVCRVQCVRFQKSLVTDRIRLGSRCERGHQNRQDEG